MSFTKINFAPGHHLLKRITFSVKELRALTETHGEGEKMLAESEEKGYGCIWYFQDNNTKETFSIYTRYGMFRIGGFTDCKKFERWLRDSI